MPGSGRLAAGRSARRAARPTRPTAPRSPITKPALGISADYGLPPTPEHLAARPDGEGVRVARLLQAGVDSGEIIIRGGSHLDFSFIPNQAFGALLRGPDLIDWYTPAWFDRTSRTIGRRQRGCSPTAGAKTPTRPRRSRHDGNAFSYYYSRDWTSIAATAKCGTARTCAPAVPA